MAGRFSIEAVFKAVDRVTAPVSRMQNRIGKFTRAMIRGLRKVNRALDKVVGGLKRGAGAAIKFGAIGIGTLTAAVALLVREFSKVEDAEAAFTPLLGGAKKAKELVDALNKTAASTPFQFENLAAATSQLLPVMNGDIENTIKTLRMLGDTAGGNAQKLDSITRGFTKAMLKGKVDMESLNMIAEAGVPIFTELADSMGVKVNAAFFKMISAGKVATTDLTKAFEKMTNKGGVFFKGMDIASRTTSGMFSTFKDNVSLTAAELGGVLAPTIKEMIAGATKMAQRIREWVRNNRELISSKFIEFVTLAKTIISKFVTEIQNMNRESSIFERLKTIVIGLSDAFSFLARHGATIAKMIAALIALSLAVKVVTIGMAAFNLIAAANPLTLILLGIVAAAALVMLAWEPVSKFFSDMWDKIKSVTSAVSGFLGFGDDDEDDKKQGATGPQIISPQDRIARTIEEQRKTSIAEVTIRDESGRAAVTGGKLGLGITLQPSGAF